MKDLEAIRPTSILDIIYSGEAMAEMVKGDVKRPIQSKFSSCRQSHQRLSIASRRIMRTLRFDVVKSTLSSLRSVGYFKQWCSQVDYQRSSEGHERHMIGLRELCIQHNLLQTLPYCRAVTTNRTSSHLDHRLPCVLLVLCVLEWLRDGFVTRKS